MSGHDEIRNGKYHRKCQDKNCSCASKYAKWCKENENSHTECKKRSYTVTEYVCEKVTVQKKQFGHKEMKENDWEYVKPIEEPKKCSKCKHKKCKCVKKY